MRRTEFLHEVRRMRFEEVLDRFRGGCLSAAEAAEWLGCSERTFRRMRRRCEARADLRQSDFMFVDEPGFVPGISAGGSYHVFPESPSSSDWML